MMISFRSIKGQGRAIAFLKGALESKRVSHAYIFSGPSGIGKRLTAMNFAKALNCLAEGGWEPCGLCVSCKKIDSSNHPDVFVLRPEKEGSRLKIDGIREVIRSIGLKPYEAKKKVYIVDGAEAMTGEAQNALLKTLEEPWSESVLVLIAERLDGLFPTIRSRCQVIEFAPLKIDELKDILIGQYKMDDQSSHVLASISAGSLGRALEYRQRSVLDVRSRVIKSLANGQFFDSDFNGLSRSDLKLYLDIILTWYRDILVAKTAAGGSPSALVNIDKKEMISAEAAHLGFEQLDNIIGEVISTNWLLDQNVNPKLAMSVLGIKLSTT